jgi:hypothetical protein
LVRVVSVLFLFASCGSLAFAQTDNWIGATGNWSDPTQWSSGIPTGGENVVIGTATANSTDNISLLDIGSLTLSNPGDILTLAGAALYETGPIENAGIITLGVPGTNFSLLRILATSTLSGKGTIVLTANGSIFGGASNIFTNASTITGEGAIGNGDMGFVNEGAVISTGSNGLLINVNSLGFTNAGTLEATTGPLFISSISSDVNLFLNYNSATGTLTGGTYIANGNFVFFPGPPNAVTTLSARITQENGGDFRTDNGDALSNLSTITSAGSLTTDIAFTQPGTFSNAGVLQLLPMTSFSVGSVAQIVGTTLTGGQWVLSSNVNITAAAANITTNSADLTLSGGTFFNAANGTNALANLSANSRALRLESLAHFTSLGSVVNTGTVTVAKGSTLTIGGSRTSYRQDGGQTTLDGTLKGTAMIDGGTLLGSGLVTGNVALGATRLATFNIGDTGQAGLFQIKGIYTQPSTGTLSVPVGGIDVVTQYSQLQVSGSANLTGAVAAPLLNSFMPAIGQTFTILTAPTIAGTFSNATIPINSSEHFAVSYTSTNVVLTVASGPA